MSFLLAARAAAAAAVLVTIPLAGVAQADSGATPPASSPPAATSSAAGAPRLTRACGRIPERITRLEKVQTRFHGDEQTRGSLAWLAARISRAQSQGHDDLARILSDRLAVRKDLDSQIPDMLTRLKDAQQICAQHGVATATGATAPSASS